VFFFLCYDLVTLWLYGVAVLSDCGSGVMTASGLKQKGDCNGERFSEMLINTSIIARVLMI